MEIAVDLIFPKADFSNEEVGEVVEKIAQDFVEKVRDNVKRSTPTGRVYGTYRASAPGQFPAQKTGRLMRDITIDKQGFRVLVNFNAPYSEFLESGTSRIAPRPFVVPTIKQISS